MSQKKIVLKAEGRKMEFEDSYWGWEHLLDYVSREMKQRTPRKVRAMKFAFVVPKEEEARE